MKQSFNLPEESTDLDSYLIANPEHKLRRLGNKIIVLTGDSILASSFELQVRSALNAIGQLIPR